MDSFGKSSSQAFCDETLLVVIRILRFRIVHTLNDFENNVEEDFLPERFEDAKILVVEYSRDNFEEIFYLIQRN